MQRFDHFGPTGRHSNPTAIRRKAVAVRAQCESAAPIDRGISRTAAAFVAAMALLLPRSSIADDQQVQRAVAYDALFDSSTRLEQSAHFSCDRRSSLSDTWSLDTSSPKDPVLVCAGAPYGYLCTPDEYDNFEIDLEWKYPESPHGNSGVLLFTSGTDRIWPKSIQVQLHSPTAGSIFPVGGASSKTVARSRKTDLAVDTWHKCKVVSRDGTVTVKINGRKTGTVSGCKPRHGRIAFQSEGAEVHFRRIRIRSLDSSAETNAKTAER